MTNLLCKIHRFLNAVALRAGRATTAKPASLACLAIVLAVLVPAGVAKAQIACRYSVAAVITPPPTPPFSSPIYPTAISPNGRWVVGSYKPGLSQYSRGFWFDMQTMQFHTLPMLPGALGAEINDVNDAGWAVGSYWINSGVAVRRGIVFDINSQAYVAELMPCPGAAWCYATGINSTNQVCGTRSIGSESDPTFPRNAFLWDGVITDLGVMDGPSSYATDIADDGTIVGTSGGLASTPYSRAFIWHDNLTTILPSVPNCINSAALVADSNERILLTGLFQRGTASVVHGFAYFTGAYSDLGVLPGRIRTFPLAVDACGQVFGFCEGDGVQPEAFAWRDGQIIPLQTLVDSTAAFLQQPYDIAQTGQVVGKGIDSQGKSIGVVLCPVRHRAFDTNCDDVVSVSDLLNVVSRWGPCPGCSADVNGDAQIGIEDLLLVILNWG